MNCRNWTSSLLKILTPAVVFASATSLLIACAAEAPTKKKRTPVNCDVEECYAELPSEIEDPLNPVNNNNSGAFGPAPERPSTSSSSSSGADGGTSSSSSSSSGDGGVLPKTFCSPTLQAGDLAIVEIMISSKAGSGDWGEWVEIQNTHDDCWLKLQGVSVESPRGAATPNTATITENLELEPRGTFVVADSTDPIKNNAIPGKVFAWNASDVLKNDGDTLNVKLGATQVDSLTYPAFGNITPGRALSFPSDCTWSDRSQWPRWSLTFGEWTPGFKGTPNAKNTDVTCF